VNGELGLGGVWRATGWAKF